MARVAVDQQGFSPSWAHLQLSMSCFELVIAVRRQDFMWLQSEKHQKRQTSTLNERGCCLGICFRFQIVYHNDEWDISISAFWS